MDIINMFDPVQEQDSSSSATPINANASQLRPLASYKQPSFTRMKTFVLLGRDTELIEFVWEQVWPGTESNCGHEDFQFCYGPGTMWYHRSSTE